MCSLGHQRPGQGTVVVLDEVEVAGRDAEHTGHRALGQTLLAAQPADLVSVRYCARHATSLSLPAVRFRSRTRGAMSLVYFTNLQYIPPVLSMIIYI